MKQNRFDFFKEGLSDIINKDNDENTGSGCIGEGGGGGDDSTPPRPPPSDVFGGNTPAEIQDELRRPMMKDFKTEDLEREISNIPRGIVKSRRSTMDISVPDNPPPIPYSDDFFSRTTKYSSRNKFFIS